MEQQVLSEGMVKHLARHGQRAKKVKPYDLAALFSLLLALVIFMYAGYFTREFTVNVTRVQAAYPYQMYTSLKSDGKVVIGRTVCLAPRIPGEVVQILVDKGDLVKKGQLVARLENTEALLSREQGEANLKLANANLEQAGIVLNEAVMMHEDKESLHAKGTLPEAEFRASETQLRKARSALNVAQATVKAREAELRRADLILGYTRINAPFDGIVLSRGVHAGDMARPLLSHGDEAGSIVTLADLGSLEVEVEVPGSEMENIRPGQPCEIIFEMKDKPFRGEVEKVMPPAAGKEKENTVVRVGLLDRDPGIMPDMNARVAFLLRQVSAKDEKPLVSVDRSALNPVRGGYSVFKVRGDRAVEMNVRVGRQFKDKVEVLEGIVLGDTLVANPPDGMKHGSKIIVRKD
jgi:RND family efflux transporter MFP subunit